MKGETAYLPAVSAVDDVDEFVARPIPGGFERSDPIAEVLLVALFRPKDEFVNAGMKPVGADDEIEAPFAAMLEFDMHLAIRLAQTSDAVTKDDLARSADPVVDELREIAAPERNVPPAGELAEYLHAKSREPSAAVIDDPQLLHVIAYAGDVGQQPHFLRDIVAETPEINHIAAGSQGGGVLDQRRRKSVFPEPEGQGGPSDARPADQHVHRASSLR